MLFEFTANNLLLYKLIFREALEAINRTASDAIMHKTLPKYECFGGENETYVYLF